MFLTDNELTELTGKKHKTCQIKAIRHMGIEHRVRPDGTIAVLREHIQKVLCGNITASIIRKKIEPNWGALNA